MDNSRLRVGRPERVGHLVSRDDGVLSLVGGFAHLPKPAQGGHRATVLPTEELALADPALSRDVFAAGGGQ